MAETVSMPKLGFDMAEGMLVRWVKKENEAIKKGDVLAEIETDKATVEVESPYTGVVLRQLITESTSVPVGDPIAIIGQAGEKVEDLPVAAVTEQTAPAEKLTQVAVTPVVQTDESDSGRNKPASPLARKIAKDNQVDLGRIHGTGPNGRIVRRDVEAAMTGTPTQSTLAPEIASMPAPKPSFTPIQVSKEDQHIPLNKLRAAIGRRMVESKNTIPHFYVTHQIRAERLMEMRKQFNEAAPEEQKLSVNDFIIKAAALALQSFPNLNASLTANEIVRHGHIQIGVAVAVEGGLLTVVVKDADLKPLRQISTEVKDMVGRVRQGKVHSDDIEGSTFSISNLGMYDVETFEAIINPPEAAILAIGSVHDAPVVEDGQVKAGKVFNATLSADHRITDGVEAARYMQELARYIENPLLMVM